ncbi:hypothetical protein OHV05_18470 [Kitasatospora sp. NBC_00070]|uniref:hypothetical protein n=1 Tax=Kitasatospora sp. NBC_00070 TaxID=2975962 RepID=UPI0032565562
MRTPVINRFAKIVPLVAVAALTAGLTVLPASTAWACGDEPAPAATEAWEHHATEPVTTIIPGTPDRITVGGPKVEFGLKLSNGTGEDYRSIAPRPALWNPQSGDVSNDLRKVNLRPEDITVEMMVDGGWKSLPLRHSCDPVLNNIDVTAGRGPLAAGQTKRFLFRLGLKSSTPVEQKSVEVHLGEGTEPLTLTMVRPPAPKTPAPKTPAAQAPAAVPAAAKDVPAAAPTPSVSPTAAATTELAETGSTTPNTFLLASAAAMVALGTGVLLMVRRTRRTRG